MCTMVPSLASAAGPSSDAACRRILQQSISAGGKAIVRSTVKLGKIVNFAGKFTRNEFMKINSILRLRDLVL